MIRNICLATDDNYLIGAKVLIASISKNTSDEAKKNLAVNLAYQPDKLSAKGVTQIKDLCYSLRIDLSMHEFDPKVSDDYILSGDQEIKHITSTTLAKFFFFETMTQPFIWLDTDIVVRVGWEEILSYDSQLSTGLPYIVVGGDAGKFNAGVLGSIGNAPIKNWKSKIGQHEMSVENHIFIEAMNNSALRIPVEFNSVSAWGDTKASTSSAKIVHYAATPKPWHFRSCLWKFCENASCGWHSWYEAAKYLSSYDQEIKDSIEVGKRPKLPKNLSWRVRLYLFFVNLKISRPLIAIIIALSKQTSKGKRIKSHPFCGQEF